MSVRVDPSAFSKNVRCSYKRWLGRHDRWLRSGEGSDGLLVVAGEHTLDRDLRPYALLVDEYATLRTAGWCIFAEGLVMVLGCIVVAPSSASHVLWDYPELADGRR